MTQNSLSTYLIKIENDQTHHSRITVHDHTVEIVQGVFYNSLNKYAEGHENNNAAKARYQQLVDEKLKEGFQVTQFKEIPENTIEIYDKAKWHFGGDFPNNLEDFQGYVHTGMFLGWLIDNDLVSVNFKSDLANEIEQFKAGKLTGAQLFKRCCDGVLLINDLGVTGNRFALQYFEFDRGPYLVDYEATLGTGLPSLYHVADTRENYLKIKQVLDKRYAEWKNHQPWQPLEG